MKLTKSVYVASEQFPKDEKYALMQQIRRAAVSIPSNIAEGQARHSSREFLRFLSNARGSLAEVQTLILLSEEFCYLSHDAAAGLLQEATEVYRLINGLVASIQEKIESEEGVLAKH